MRVLWVEDNDRITAEKQQNWFGEFNQTEHIVRKTDFSQAYQTIREEPRRYDLVILDINLEHSASVNLADFEGKIVIPKENEIFLKEAGFHLYLQLILNCFPQDKIIFLTSNVDSENQIENYLIELRQAYSIEDQENMNRILEQVRESIHAEDRPKFDDMLENPNNFEKLLKNLKSLVFARIETIPGETVENTFREFERRFEDARLPKPKVVDKKRDCAVHLQNWLNTHCRRTKENQAIFDYLTLRRAMLDIIDEIYQETNTVLQSPFDAELDKNSFLDGLKWQLHDFNLPEKPHETVYFALCDYLTNPFEQRFEESRRSEFSSLKMLRNWLAHGLIKGSKSTLTAQVTGIVFLLAFKKLFNVEKYGFRDEIKRIFLKSEINISIIKNKANDFKKVTKIKQRGCKEISSKVGCKTKNENWQNEDFVELFYTSFFCSDSYQSDREYFSKIIDQEISL